MNSNEPSACKFEEISLYGVVLELMHKLRHCQSHLFVNTTHFLTGTAKSYQDGRDLALVLNGFGPLEKKSSIVHSDNRQESKE